MDVIRACSYAFICFDNENTLIITNEQMELFEIPLEDLIRIE